MQQDFSVIHGAHSTTFSTPPLDGTLTVPELFAFHAAHSGTHKLFVYANNDSVHSIDYATAFRAQLVVAGAVKAAFDEGASLYPEEVSRPVFGILAIADSVTYATVVLGIQQTGAIPFPISTRNSDIAISQLLRSTGVRQVFVSEDIAMRTLAANALKLLANDEYRLSLIDLPRFEMLYETPAPFLSSHRIALFSLDATAIVLHSSGTSAFPRPIPVTHRGFISFGISYYYGEVDVCGTRVGIHTAPMFHALGAYLLVHAVCTGMELAVFPPVRPPIVSDAATFLEHVEKSRAEWVVSVPSLIEEWWQDSNKIKLLTGRIRRVLYGGAPLEKKVGDAIHEQGIILDCFYGTTETGPLCMLMASGNARPTEWEYFRLPSSRLATIRLVSYDDQKGLSELVLLSGPRFGPAVLNTTVDGNPGFATGDLVQEHASYKGFFKLFGRADEQIMLSTGEKTNPVPLERILMQDPNIQAALFFGRGHFNNGVLVQPARPFQSSDFEKVAAFRNTIWPTVVAMNAYAPAHSRLLKEMILIASPDKPLELTAKGTARRNTCLALYAQEIESIYSNADGGSQVELSPPTSWSARSISQFVRALVRSVLNQDAEEDDDLFFLGCDSLQATIIRNTIVRSLRVSPTTSSLTRQIPQTLVYHNASIRALCDYISSLLTPQDCDPDDIDSLEDNAREMERMVAKYSVNFPSLRVPAGTALPSLDTVLVTGTTGRLGSHLLEQLLKDPKVRHIYALNRATAGKASSESLLERMRCSFEAWRLDPDLLLGDKVTLLAGDYTSHCLGLEADVYAKIQSEHTTIIHNAWRVNFNIALSGFESLVASVRYLVDLAAGASVAGGARILFISSVSILQGSSADGPALEEPVTDARVAAGTGYSESKWVGETILLRAHTAVGLHTAVVRVGQLAGDTRVGGWSKQEWVGAIARLGQIVYAIPDRDELIFWVPVDIAATALIDMARSNERFFNLVSPTASNWHIIFDTFATRLDVPLIKYDEWSARVNAAAETNTREDDMQPLALANYFQVPRLSEAKIDCARACAVSPTLANTPPLGVKDAMLYLSFWESIGHLRVYW